MKLDEDLEARLDREIFDRVRNDRLPRRYFGRYESSLELLRQIASRSFGDFRALDAAAPDFATRTIIRLYKRPSLLVRQGSFTVPEGDFWQQTLEEHRAAIEAALPAVGRIEFKDHPSLAWGGTGFLVDAGVIATNRHVADLFVLRDGQGFAWRKGAGGVDIGGRIDFREEHGVPDVEEFPITAALHIEPTEGPDLALLKIDATGLKSKPLTLATTAAEEDLVATIGYPFRDSRLAAELEEAMERIFGGIYDVKRLAPGRITKVDATTFSHDCTTLPGNSGSAVIDIETGEVAGIHFGDNVDANVAVPASILAARLGEI